jgi:ketosteroid isomerase-like protein
VEGVNFFVGGGGFGTIETDDGAELQRLIAEHPFTPYSEIEVRPLVELLPLREILTWAMSQENVELMRQATEALLRRDRAAWLALHGEDVEAIPIPDWPEPAMRGREVWDFLVKLMDAFEPIPIGRVEFVDAGADKVLTHQRTDFRGRGSGAEVEFEYWIVSTIQEGQIRRGQWFVDRAEALEAAGLSE